MDAPFEIVLDGLQSLQSASSAVPNSGHTCQRYDSFNELAVRGGYGEISDKPVAQSVPAICAFFGFLPIN
jgi:hypothetical protein